MQRLVDYFTRHEREKLAERERTISDEVNRRVAQTLAQMDPFEPLLKEFHGIFSEEHERVEDPLDEKGQLQMKIWGWQNSSSPEFKRMTEWVMNTQGNESLKRAAVTPERILYGRAQISGMILFVREVERLSEAYKDMLKKPGEFDESATVE
jgi:hypothetical protein